MKRRQLVLASALAVALPQIRAQGWPDRPIKLIIPGGPGGATDVRGRWLADRLGPLLGQPIVLDYKPGAGGNIAAQVAARSIPDGNTLLLIHQGLAAINPHVYSQPGYDPFADFAWITTVGESPLVLALHPEVKASSLQALIALSRSKPGKMTYGSPGIGTPPHLAAALFARHAAIAAVHVPYKTGGPMLQDLLGGQIDWAMDSISLLLPHIRAGKLRAVAMTGRARAPVLPEVATFAELGLAECEYISWMGLAAPAATPQSIISKLHEKTTDVLNSADAQAWFRALGGQPAARTPEQFAALVRDDHARLGQAIRDADIRVDR